MTLERDHDRTHAPDAPTTTYDDVAPGRSNRSNQLASPDRPLVSALILRKARDANGVADGADAAVATASTSSGTALPGMLMRKFESSLGADLSSVRVHTGSDSQTAAHSVGAKAYTVGNDIHFGAGQFDPTSHAGQHLLAHEVAHTVQQQGGVGRKPMFKLEVSTTTDGFEIEADQAADAMVAGAPASVGANGTSVNRKSDPTTTVVGPDDADPDHQAHANVDTSGNKVTWDDKYNMADGSVSVTKKSGLDMYGADAISKGIKPDPSDPFGTDPLSIPNWETTELAGPSEPGTWACGFAPKQPLPVSGPDSMKGGAMTPIPVQESQIAFAQSCVDAFQGAHTSAKRSWELMAPNVKEFNKAGSDPAFQEGGLNWLPTTNPTDAQKNQSMDQLAGQQTVGDGKTTVNDVIKMTPKDADGLKSDLSADKKAALEKEAGKPAAALAACKIQYDEVAVLTKDQKTAEGKLRTAYKAVDLTKLADKKDEAKEKLSQAKEKQQELSEGVEIAIAAIEVGLSLAAPELHEMPITAAKSIITIVVASHYEEDIKKAAAKIKSIAKQMGDLSVDIAVDQVIHAAADLESAADKIAIGKRKLVIALKTAEDAHEAFAKEVGKQVGGKKGEQARAAIEALPKVAAVAKLCQTIADAADVPPYTPKGGIGMLGAAVTPQSFAQHCGQLKGYHSSFAAKAKQWGAARDQLDAIAKSYGLGN